jgi:hypothetical protein
LESEDVFDRGSPSAIRGNLRSNGATEKEIEFLLEARVELNALTSDQLIAFIERKLAKHKIAKVIPGKERLAEAYKLFARSARIQEVVKTAIEQETDEAIKVPAGLAKHVRRYLSEHPEVPWEQAVDAIAGANNRADDEGGEAAEGGP